MCDTLFDFVDLYVAVCDDSKVGSPFGPGTPPVPSAIDCHARNRVSIEKPRVHKRPSIPTITSTRSTSGSSRTRRKKTNTSQSEVPQLLDGSSFENEMMEADTTTLSHIFSVSTPRQLAPKEQARRRDILKYLEKCQEKKRQHENDKKNFQQRKEEMKKRFHELHGAEYTFDHHGEIIRIQSVPISNTNGINRTIIGCKVGSLEEPEAEEATRLNRKRNRKITDKLEPPISNGFIPTPVVHMESANLVQGVRSIHLGVSKEGPKRVPSRRSRVLRHNYKLKPESREKMPKIQPCKPVEARTTLSLPALKVRVNDNSKQVTQAMDRMEKRVRRYISHVERKKKLITFHRRIRNNVHGIDTSVHHEFEATDLIES